MKKSDEKKGLSPVIATVLLIVLVVVLASLVFLWARGFVTEQIEKFGVPIEEMCSKVNLKIALGGLLNKGLIEISNRGDINVRYLEVKKIQGGNSEVNTFEVPVDAGDSKRVYLDFLMNDSSDPDKVVVYPALIGNVRGKNINRPFVCLNEGITLQDD